MRIGELAAATSCEIETIRYYEREGLLDAPARSSSGYRQYGQRNVEQLNFVRHCRSLDMSLADIKRLALLAHDPQAACGDVNALVDSHIARVRSKLASLRALERQLVRLRGECASVAAGQACRIVESLQQAAHGEACACHPAHAAAVPATRVAHRARGALAAAEGPPL